MNFLSLFVWFMSFLLKFMSLYVLHNKLWCNKSHSRRTLEQVNNETEFEISIKYLFAFLLLHARVKNSDNKYIDNIIRLTQSDKKIKA